MGTPIPPITQKTTVNAIGCADRAAGYELDSLVATATYTTTTVTAGTPSFTPPAGAMGSVTRRCKWGIEAEMGSVIQLTFSALHTVSGDCFKEYIMVKDGIRDDAPTITRNCGTAIPNTVISS